MNDVLIMLEHGEPDVKAVPERSYRSHPGRSSDWDYPRCDRAAHIGDGKRLTGSSSGLSVAAHRAGTSRNGKLADAGSPALTRFTGRRLRSDQAALDGKAQPDEEIQHPALQISQVLSKLQGHPLPSLAVCQAGPPMLSSFAPILLDATARLHFQEHVTRHFFHFLLGQPYAVFVGLWRRSSCLFQPSIPYRG